MTLAETLYLLLGAFLGVAVSFLVLGVFQALKERAHSRARPSLERKSQLLH
jgi:hypothetical protein